MLTVLNLNTSPPNVGTLKIVGITAGAAIAVILGILLILIVKKVKTLRKPPPTDAANGETNRLLESHTPPQYGSSDGTVTLPRLGVPQC